MTLVGAPDWQQQIAATSTLLASTSRNSNAVFNLPIQAALLPQHLGIVVAVVFKAGNASTSVDWQLIDATLGIGLLLDTVQLNTQTNVQVMTFPGAYAVANPSNTLNVQFTPSGPGNLVADVYVYGVTHLPLSIPQPRQADTGLIVNSGPITVPAASTGNVLGQATGGFVHEIIALSGNHATAAAAVTRVQWIDQFGTNPHFETFDTATANQVWNVVPGIPFRNSIGLSFVNGSSQPWRVFVTYRDVPQ